MEIALDRDGEAEFLAFDEIAVGNGFASAGDDAVFNGELIFGNTELLGGEIEQRLMNVGSSLANIGHTALKKIEGAAAIGSAIGIGRDYVGDGIKGSVEFVGDNLAVSGKDGALAEI